MRVMKEINFIDTSTYWEEMSGIAQDTICEIERVLEETKVETISTNYGYIYYDKDEEEAYIKALDKDPQPLRELDTQEILYIADEVNDFISDFCEILARDRNGKGLMVGQSVKWYDPQPIEGNEDRVFQVDDIINEEMILISDEFGSAEVPPQELEIL